VYASNAARLEQSYREVAVEVKIAGRKDPRTNIYKLVHDWLRDEKKGKWRLILDNVNNDRFLHEASVSGFSKYKSPRQTQIKLDGILKLEDIFASNNMSL
jgi:hypothetical protein